MRTNAQSYKEKINTETAPNTQPDNSQQSQPNATSNKNPANANNNKLAASPSIEHKNQSKSGKHSLTVYMFVGEI